MTQKTISKIRAASPIQGGAILAIVCPACRREGNFTVHGGDLQVQVPVADRTNMVRVLHLGHRLCPNPQCMTHVFVVHENGQLIRTHPTGRIDFDQTDVPDRVIKAFEEALSCTADECYIAAAMLIRKTLEAVCEDRGAKGDNLKDRILDLKTKVTLPTELFTAMDHLRLLGNDAAHIEAKDYDGVGQDEVLAGVVLTKEIIKSTYQYKSLLGRLIALKRP